MAASALQPLYNVDFSGFVRWEYLRLQHAIFDPTGEFNYGPRVGRRAETTRGCASLPFAFFVAYGNRANRDY